MSSANHGSLSFIKIIIRNMQIILVERIAQLKRTQYGGSGENVVVNDGAVARQSTGRSGIPRTCRDAHLADPSLSSGK